MFPLGIECTNHLDAAIGSLGGNTYKNIILISKYLKILAEHRKIMEDLDKRMEDISVDKIMKEYEKINISFYVEINDLLKN